MAAWTLPHRIAEWISFLSAALDQRSRKHLPVIILGMILSSGRRTVSSWLRAVGVNQNWQDHYYFLQTLGRSAGRVATQLLHLAVRQIPVSHVGPYVKLAIDDSPTKRHGPNVELAGTHHNPTPGPSGSEFLYGHVWVTISWMVHHPLWGCIGLPLRSLMYSRQKDLQTLENVGKAPWRFRTKLHLAAELVELCVALPGAVMYDVFVRDRNTGAVVLSQTNIRGTVYTPSIPIPDGQYHWFAAGISADGIRSFETAAIDIYIGGGTDLLTPSGSTGNRTPLFTWRLVDGAARYDLYVNQLNGLSQIIREQNLNTNSFSPGTALPTGRYRAWIRAVSNSGEIGPWSSQRDFFITAAMIATPPLPDKSELLIPALALLELDPSESHSGNPINGQRS